MPLPKDKWPTIHFYDVSKDKQVKVDASDCYLKSGSTKGHGPGRYFQIVADKPGRLDYKLYKFVSEEKFKELKELMKASPKPKKSRKCNMTASGKKVTKAKCIKKNSCTWVKGKRGSRKGYCRKS